MEGLRRATQHKYIRKKNIDYIYIYPSVINYKMKFLSLSLSECARALFNLKEHIYRTDNLLLLSTSQPPDI